MRGEPLQILCIEKHTPTRFLLWVRDGDKYKKLIVEAGKAIEELTAVPVADYKDYDHFVGVMGKFNPWYIFNDVPVNVTSIDFVKAEELSLKFDLSTEDVTSKCSEKDGSEE